MADRPGSVALGTNVRALRRSRGLKQVELAAKAGIDKSYLSRIETGTRPANPELLERLAEALDVDPGALDESTVLETRSTMWIILYAAEPENWKLHSEEILDRDEAKRALEELRELEKQRGIGTAFKWRAVRVETIETVEVW